MVSGSEQTKNKQEFVIPGLPSIEIGGKTWEYRAMGAKVIRYAQEKQKEMEQISDDIERMEKDAEINRGLLQMIFVKGDELYEMIDEIYQGDEAMWIEFIGELMVKLRALQPARHAAVTRQIKAFEAGNS